MKKFFRKFIRFIVISLVLLLLLIAIGIGLAIYFINDLVKTGIQRGGTLALGVPTQVDQVDLRIMDGQLHLTQLNIENPKGFTSANFMAIGKASAQVTLASLRSDVVEIPSIQFDTVELALEKNDKSANYDVILANIKAFETKVHSTLGTSSKPSEPQPAPTQAPSSKRVVIRQIVINDVLVHATVKPLAGMLGTQNVKIKIPQIILKDIGNDSNQAVLADQLSGIVVAAILRAVVEHAGTQLPSEIGKGLNQGLNALGNLGVKSLEVVGKVGVGVLEGVGKGIGEVGKGIGNLFGSDSKPEEKK